MGARGERPADGRVRELAAAVPRPGPDRRLLRLARTRLPDGADVAARLPVAARELAARHPPPPRHACPAGRISPSSSACAASRRRGLEGIDLSSLALRLQRRRAGEPGHHRANSRSASRRYGFAANAFAPVYGLAESSVGLAFPAAARAGRDRPSRPRRASRASGEAVEAPRRADAAPRSSSAAARPLPRPRHARGGSGRAWSCPTGRKATSQFRGPSSTSGYYRNPEATKTLFARRLAEYRRPRLPRRRHALLTGREKDIIIRGGRNISPYELEQAVGDLAGHPQRLRRGVRQQGRGHRHRARGRARGNARQPDARAHDAPAAHDQRPRGRPDRRARRRHRARAAAHGAEDLQRQDPPRRRRASSTRRGPQRSRAARCGCSSRASLLAGAAPQLRRGLRTLGGALFALRGAMWLFAALIRRARLAAAAAPASQACWRVGRRRRTGS